MSDDDDFYRWFAEHLRTEQHPALKTSAKAAWYAAREATICECYNAARGTDNLKDPRFTRSQMYWKGRADAANNVRGIWWAEK